MPHPTSHPAPFPRPLAAALLALGAAVAQADDGGVSAADLPVAVRDEAVAVAAAIDALPSLSAAERGDPRATNVVLATRLDTSVDAIGDAVKPAEVPLVKPTPKPATSVAARPIRVERASVSASPAQVRLIEDQAVELHADGLPTPNAPSTDPFERVLPRAFDPNGVFVGARWGAQDKLALPLGTKVALSAQADMLTGAAGLRANAVRRSLRLVAQWDDIDSLVFGLTPGVSRGGGNVFEHYVAGLQASTLDPARSARWRSFVEVSGEKLAPNNVYDNSSAQVRAGASFQASTAAQLDVSVSRGTMDKPDTQSSVGLSMKF